MVDSSYSELLTDHITIADTNKVHTLVAFVRPCIDTTTTPSKTSTTPTMPNTTPTITTGHTGFGDEEDEASTISITSEAAPSTAPPNGTTNILGGHATPRSPAFNLGPFTHATSPERIENLAILTGNLTMLELDVNIGNQTFNLTRPQFDVRNLTAQNLGMNATRNFSVDFGHNAADGQRNLTNVTQRRDGNVSLGLTGELVIPDLQSENE